MPETISVSMTATPTWGGSWTFNTTLTVDAIDVTEVVLPANTSDRMVPIQPGGDVRLLYVLPDTPGAELSYATAAGAATAYKLDTPHLLTGDGGLALLAVPPAPTTLYFSNTGATEARIRILVGRNVP